MQWRDGLGEARLRLQPEHLGQVTVSLKIDGQSVTALVRTETAAAQAVIQQNQLDLKTALQAQGLNLDHLVVEVDPDGRRGQRHAPQPSPRRQRQLDASGGTPLFEVTV